MAFTLPLQSSFRFLNVNQSSRPKLIVVGLIGGVASGKSVVAKQFRELGAEVIDGDKLGHLVLTDPEVIRTLKDRWGKEVIDAEGQLIRREIAKRVFADDSELEFLEKLTHPRIGERIKQRIEEIGENCREEASTKVVVLDAAIMLKAGWDEYCDHLMYVHAELEQRRERAIQRGWTVENFEMRESAQLSTEEKRRRSDIVIDNTGCLGQTCEQVLKAWNSFSRD